MKNVLTFLFLHVVINGDAQTLRQISILPSYLNENSGLIVKSRNSVWTHNDSGDGPILYKIDSMGILLDSLFLNGVIAKDFEDIAQDVIGNVYVGDIGNNAHDRTDLVIYKISNPDSIVGNNTTPEYIQYSYSDQTQFPDPNQNADCEALFHYNNHLYLITKNWGSSGFSKLYKLPDTAGIHVAQLIDSFASPMVTAADFHSSGKLAVLSMDRVSIFDGFTGDDFFGGRNSTFFFPLTQKEGVSFVNANSLYITQENHRFFPGAKLYEFRFENLLSLNDRNEKKDFSLSPNPSTHFIEITPNLAPNEVYNYTLYNAKGQVMAKQNNLSSKTHLSTKELNTGIYFVLIRTNTQHITKRFIKQ